MFVKPDPEEPPTEQDFQRVHSCIDRPFESMNELMDTVSPKYRDAMSEKLYQHLKELEAEGGSEDESDEGLKSK